MATDYLEDYLKASYRLGQLSRMSPGDLELWPIDQQKELFLILGNAKNINWGKPDSKLYDDSREVFVRDILRF